MKLLRVREAAQQLGISFPTLKQWIYQKKIRTIQTAGGHHRVPQSEVNRLLFQKGPVKKRSAERTAKFAARGKASVGISDSGLGQIISGRNQLVGRIVTLETVGLLAKVKLDIGGQTVTAIITRDAARDLRLKVGEVAAALIKATEVMIIRSPEGKS
jgi:molybdopterin-binding protein